MNSTCDTCLHWKGGGEKRQCVALRLNENGETFSLVEDGFYTAPLQLQTRADFGCNLHTPAFWDTTDGR